MDAPVVDFEAFRTSWLESVTEGQPTTTELGRRFALKVVTQWIDASEATADLVYCDGAGDGGIDVAVLDMGPDESNDEPEESGHSWYLIQSKYGSAFSGTDTLLREGQKVIDTLDGKRPKLNSLAEGLQERLSNFRNAAGQSDRVVLVFATERNLLEPERRVLDDLRAMGRARIGTLFDVEAISIETIFQRLQEQEAEQASQRLGIELKATFAASGGGLLVGAIKLTNLYDFLKSYRAETGDLDRIYEKNVRRFLGARGKVNRAMQATLREAPERFGLYNNGITIVVHDFEEGPNGVMLIEPYIVNGCQTTRTIWEVCHQRLSSGGTGSNPERDQWKARAEIGVVVAKIVKVGEAGGEVLLGAITRYTNSQNAVREKDFLALTGDFRTWQRELSDHYDLYLEIQRGGWDSQKALQNNTPKTKQFIKHSNAADLIKVFGAGWLGEAGTAFGKNPPFLPDGSVFKRIVNASEADGGAFGADDLFAAYLLQQATTAYGFGRAAEKQSRRQTRFLFYMVVVELLKDIMSRSNVATNPRSISASMIKVLRNPAASLALLDQAIEVIDSYLMYGSDDSVFLEPSYLNSFNSDLNAFLKSEQLGKSDAATPRLRSALTVNKSVMGRAAGGHPSPRQIVMEALQ